MRPALGLLISSIIAYFAVVADLSPAYAQGEAQFDLLGRVILTIGQDEPRFGYSEAGAYGSLDAGEFPAGLFADGVSRPVAGLYDTPDSKWRFVAGGTPATWITADMILVAEYEDGKDSRRFHLDGFTVSKAGDTLTLQPPVTTREWRGREGQAVTFDFYSRVKPTSPVSPPPLVDPVGVAGSFTEFLATSTPGGPVMAQTLIVIVVYLMLSFRASPNPQGVLLMTTALIMTPWIPVLFGFGSTIAAVIVLVNVAAGSFSYKVFAARTE